MKHIYVIDKKEGDSIFKTAKLFVGVTWTNVEMIFDFLQIHSIRDTHIFFDIKWDLFLIKYRENILIA